jgi:hypothetical protein
MKTARPDSGSSACWLQWHCPRPHAVMILLLHGESVKPFNLISLDVVAACWE